MKALAKLTLFLLIPICAVGLRSQELHHSTIRILDINVWSGLNYEGYIRMGEYETAAVREKRYQALVSQLKQLDPDIIGIHEANKLPRYAKRLAEATGHEAFYHVGVGGVRLGPIGLPWNLREGDVILAKKYLSPQFAGRRQLSGGYVGNWATFHLSDATQVIAVRIVYRNTPMFIFATHWHASLSGAPYILAKAKELYDAGEAGEEEYHKVLARIKEGVDWRLSESQKTLEFIQRTAKDDPFILMGDFNAEPGSQEIKNLLQFGMVDVFRTSNPGSPGFTWDPNTNLNHLIYYRNETSPAKDLGLYERLERFSRATPKRMDYIFLGPLTFLDSQRISIKESKVVMKEIVNGVHASDHYGVFAEIELHQ